jgi:hypothetical protein
LEIWRVILGMINGGMDSPTTCMLKSIAKRVLAFLFLSDQLATEFDGGSQSPADGTVICAKFAEFFQNCFTAVLFVDLPEYDVSAVEPRGRCEGDKELGAISENRGSVRKQSLMGDEGRELTYSAQSWPSTRVQVLYASL